MAAWLPLPSLRWPWTWPWTSRVASSARARRQQVNQTQGRLQPDQRVLLPLHGLGVLYGHLQVDGAPDWHFQGWEIGPNGMAVSSGQRLEVAISTPAVVVFHDSEGHGVQDMPVVLSWLDRDRNGFCFAGVEFIEPLPPGSYGARFLRPGVHHLY